MGLNVTMVFVMLQSHPYGCFFVGVSSVDGLSVTLKRKWPMGQRRNKMKNTNKKLIAVVVVIAVVLGGFGLYKLLSPKGEEGNKEVTINVIVESESINFTDKYNTDEEFLQGLLEEKGDLNLVKKDTEYGPMVMGLKGYEVDDTKEYFNINVNGEDAMTGIKEIPIKDGDVYTFEVKGF